MCSAPRIGNLMMMSITMTINMMIMMMNWYKDGNDMRPIDGVVVDDGNDRVKFLVKLSQPVTMVVS